MYKELFNKISEYETIIIHRHVRPDGDAIGSQIGLKEAIIANFKNKKVLVTGDDNEHFHFLGKMDEVKDSDYVGSLVIVVDTSYRHLISDDRYNLGKYLIKIDHHFSGENFGDLELVDKEEISCSSLIVKWLIDGGYKLTDAGARALFTGIVTDSFRFRYLGVNSQTFSIASFLTSYNFSIEEIYKILYTEEEHLARLRSQFMLKMQSTKNNVRYIKTTYEEVVKHNVGFYFISRELVSSMSGIKDVDIWVNFTQDEHGFVHAELRSTKYNINNIAVKYGGGGHILASGARLMNFYEADQMLNDLDELIKEEE